VEVRFEDLLQRYEKEIFRFVRRMTGNSADAADVLQDTFLRAFKSFSKLPREANHRAWLYRIAGRQALNLARSKKVRRAFPIEEAVHLPERNGDLEALVETRRLARVLAGALHRLSPRQRIALIQRKYEGLSYLEIAEVLGCSEETARAHVYQAMNKIRRGLASPAPDSDQPLDKRQRGRSGGRRS
jgi:RNA polymerase sigma-70 factor (ECF subfamily)